MAKLYFKFGCMGSSKTANALMTKFNYEEKGNTVVLLKPSIDTRDGVEIVKSRIGLEAKAIIVYPDIDIINLLFKNNINNDIKPFDCIIIDECQFLTVKQVEQLKIITDIYDIPVICYGLRTDFKTNLFDASKRLFEIADSIAEIKSVCSCGKKAIVNARIDSKGNIVYEGEQVELGGNDKYIGNCYSCWIKGKKNNQ